MARTAHDVVLESDVERRSVTDHRSAGLRQELLELLARNSSRVPIPVFLATGLIAAVVYDTTRMVWPLVWLAGVAVFLTIRYACLTRLPAQVHLSAEARLRIAIVLSGMNGALHGAVLFFFPLLDEFDRLLVTIMALSLCAGSVGSTVGYRPVLLAYVLPILVPLSVLWAANPGAEAGWREMFVAGLILLFIVLLLTLARDAFRLFRESFEIRFEHDELNQKLEKALEESKTANDAKTRFLAAASHDLRQPVHALALFSAALSRRPLDERTHDIAKHVQSAIDALSLQLDALLDISKLDAGVIEPDRTSFKLRPMLERLREQFTPLTWEKGLVLVIQCPDDAAVHTDEKLLEQIIRNLLSNAVKYTDAGTISVQANMEHGKYLLAVSDTGRGIPTEARDQVFEEFFQMDNPSRDRSRGLGLGLAIVKRLVELLDIPLEMKSDLGKGTMFKLTLTPAAATMERATSPGAEFCFDQLTVLAVDNETEVLAGMEILLGGLGCNVLVAGSTAQALDTVKQVRPDVVLCDFLLGDQDNGLDTIERIREIHPALPAVLVTGDTSVHRLHDAGDARLIILHKPMSVQALTVALEQAFGQAPDTGHAE